MDKDVSTIFAQWHGMPSRTLVSDPNGKVMKLSVEEFLELEKKMIFKKNIAHDKIARINAKGDTVYKAGNPNGWLIEQGGYLLLLSVSRKGISTSKPIRTVNG